MKNISRTLLIGALAGVSLISCERDITSLNEDPKHPSEVPSGNLLASSQYNSFYDISSPSVNGNNFVFFTQQLAEVTYTDETNYDLVTRNQPRRFFNSMYVSGINVLKQSKVALEKEKSGDVAVDNNKWAVLEISEIFLWESVVNTYGNVPYSEAFSPDQTLSPKYDDAATIYSDLIKRLDGAIAKVTPASKGYMEEDLVYKGDMLKWKKFANSIKLRLAMNLADVNPSLAKSTAEAAITAGVMASNTDSYSLVFDGGTFTNPVYDEFVASNRNDFVPSSVVVNLMNTKADPRRSVWFTKTEAGSYVGGAFGSRNPFARFSHYQNVLLAKNAPANLLSYSEVLFLQAEAAARGYSAGNTAEEFYKLAVTASMQEQGVSASDIATYVAANPYNSANWKKSIGEEAYVALFNKAYASWNFLRRLDYPVLNRPGNSNITSPYPYRMPYSSWEYTRNGTNVRAAASVIGGDKAETKLFWDIH